MNVQVYNPGVKVSVRESDRVRSAGFWFDFATDDLVAMRRVRASSGLVYGTYGRGRFVYMGFQRNAMGLGSDDPDDVRIGGYFFRNAMNYLRRLPTIWIRDWPGDHGAAAMITSTARTPAQVRALAGVQAVLDSLGMPGTWFVDPAAASGTGDLLTRLNESGDVGLAAPADVRPDGTITALTMRLTRLREQLEALSGGPVTGYRPARSGAVPEFVMEALVRSGFEYFVPDSIGRVNAPYLMRENLASLTRIGTTSYGPGGRVGMLEGIPVSLLRDLLTANIERVGVEGGLYNFVLDSPAGSDDAVVDPGLVAAAELLADRDMWIAPGDEIALWWRLRRNIGADVQARSRSRLYVRVFNNNGHTADDVRVSIALGRSVDAVNVRPELIDVLRPVPDERDRPPWRLSSDGTVLELSIRRLKPQQYRIFHIDLVGGEPSPDSPSRETAPAPGAGGGG
jgi:hypothetical protein